MSMSTMTYGEELPGGEAGRKLSFNPLASDRLPELEHSAVTPFVRPGPEVLSEAIPVFFIGRNRDGFWVARNADGKFGGLFWSKEAATRFTKSIWPAGCATIFPQTRFELDLENAGSSFVAYVGPIRRLLAHGAYRSIAAVRKLSHFGKRG
jgi:hypothetical protein